MKRSIYVLCESASMAERLAKCVVSGELPPGYPNARAALNAYHAQPGPMRHRYYPYAVDFILGVCFNSRRLAYPAYSYGTKIFGGC